jgi:predicted acylesterase/phospholipase RssA
MKALQLSLVASAASLLFLGGCATPTRGPAVPADAQDRAVIPEFHAIRSWADQLDEPFLDEIKRAAEREVADRRARGEPDKLPVADFLAISGGGANGAYGAGLLQGWSETGTRPEFKVVTGISTGALTAPFAFLGSAHDETLRRVYTTVRTKDIARSRSMLAALFDDALTDYEPLKGLLARTVDASVLQAIAGEYQRGRLLLIGTTNLDSQRGVVWNVTAIAASGHPRALALVHQILLASAAIPAAFPPVMIDVDVDGRRYQEMHVDGGAVSQVFFYPPTLRLTSEQTGVERSRRLWVIRNARLAPVWSHTDRKTLSIAGRAIDSLILSQGLGDLYRIYATSRRDHVEFKLAHIPDDFHETPKEAFDPPYMQKLFDVGRTAAMNGSAWVTAPPGFELPETRENPTLAPPKKP